MTVLIRISQMYHQPLVVDHSQLEASQATGSPSTRRVRCPICGGSRALCDACTLVFCQNDRCGEWKFDPPDIKSCRWHGDDCQKKLCESCRLKERQSDPLEQCPVCSHWYCSALMKKCLGRPTTFPGLARNHDPKSTSCMGCFISHMGPTGAHWNSCLEPGCWSTAHDVRKEDSVICHDCSGSMDITCPCGKTYVCSVCAQKKVLQVGRHCPRCQTFYCFHGCKYIETCAGCQKARLCNDCIEVEEDATDEEDSSNTHASLMIACKKCQTRVCAECFDGSRPRYACEGCDGDHDLSCMNKCRNCGALCSCTNCDSGYCEECWVCWHFTTNFSC